MNNLIEIFKDKKLIDKIKKKLPYLFNLAEIECSRAGKIGMQVGSLRENIIISLLIYKFGEKNIETTIPITENDIDVKVYGMPVSIKTISNKNLSGIKLTWTVDTLKAKEFLTSYYPKSDLLLTHISWNNFGGLYLFPLEIQEKIFKRIGREKYIKLPKEGTNPRGIELSKEAIIELLKDRNYKIEIFWNKENINVNPYKRWIDFWKEG